MSLETVIGLEIHLELATKSKMFCRCSADHFGKAPNTQTCPVCLGLPGALPYPNRQAIDWTLLFGLALNCEIPLEAKFDRKNYFYPDLPKGYQISQYDQPFAQHGWVEIDLDGQPKKIGINRVHLEEDTGKLQHQIVDGQKVSLIDFNRSSVPLVEIVSEPQMSSAAEAVAYARKIQAVARALKISGADMEKGQMRLELNLSLRPKGQKELPPYRVEVKNINSFRFLEKAAASEIKRQTKILATGKMPDQETWGFDAQTKTTFLQRRKEDAHDYRYFPEPDIPPFHWQPAEIEALRAKLPELPDQKKARLVKQYSLTADQAAVLIKKNLVDVLEKTVSFARGLSPAVIANALINDRDGRLSSLPPAKLAASLAPKTSSFSAEALEAVVEKIILAFPDEAQKYRQGKQALIQFFIGQVMRETKGQAAPDVAQKVLVKKLS